MQIEFRGNFPQLHIGGPRHLAHLAGVPLDQLNAVALKTALYYRPRDLPKPDGGTRRIDVPRGRLKVIQANLDEELFAPAISSPLGYGSIPGKRHTDVFAIHAGQQLVATVDIEDFFPSVTNEHVFKLLCRMGANPRTASLATKLVTHEGHLPQGSPASPSIANLLLSGVDQQLARYDRRNGVRITRVVDDITVSGSRDEVERLVPKVIGLIRALGLHVNRRKLRLVPNTRPQVVMNAHVNTRPALPRSRRVGRGLVWDELRAAARGSVKGIGRKARASLLGKLNYAASFNVTRAARLRQTVVAAKSLDEATAAVGLVGSPVARTQEPPIAVTQRTSGIARDELESCRSPQAELGDRR